MDKVTLYNSNTNLEYYHIPKNGMTSLIKTLNVKWEYISEIPKERTTLAVLREPISRFMSSFNYLLNRRNREHIIRDISKEKLNKIFNKQNIKQSIENYISEIEENGFFDHHNLPQINYLNGDHDLHSNRKISDINIFIDFELLKDKTLNIDGNVYNTCYLNSSNSITKNKVKQEINYFTDRIIKLYEEDYILYKNKIG